MPSTPINDSSPVAPLSHGERELETTKSSLRFPFRSGSILRFGFGTHGRSDDTNQKASFSRKSVPSSPTVEGKSAFRRTAISVAAVMFVLGSLVLLVSIPHLVQGVIDIARCGFVTALFVALVFDLSQLAAEAALLVSRFVHLEARILLLCRGQIMAFTTMSSVLNVKAFCRHTVEPFDVTLAWVWGILLPISVLVLFAIGSSLALAVAQNSTVSLSSTKNRSNARSRHKARLETPSTETIHGTQ